MTDPASKLANMQTPAAGKRTGFETGMRDPAELEKVPAPPGTDDTGRGVRATRRQVSVVAEAESEVGEDSADSAEGIGQEVVDVVESQLASDQGRKELARELDGLEPEERDRKEARAMDRTLDRLEGSKELDIEVVSAATGRTQTVVTETGQKVKVKLRANEKSRMIEKGDGSKVLVIAEDLNHKEAAKETTEAVAEVIEEVARESGVTVSDDFMREFTLRIPRHIRRQIFRTSVDYGRYLYHAMVL